MNTQQAGVDFEKALQAVKKVLQISDGAARSWLNMILRDYKNLTMDELMAKAKNERFRLNREKIIRDGEEMEAKAKSADESLGLG